MPEKHDDQQLVLVHLSDIHFRRWEAEPYDLDEELRNEVTQDVGRVRGQLGEAHAILVTGDIAFSGRSEEYGVAADWLGQLARQAGCPEENVWTVPGNHDVDRSAVKQSPLLQAAHRELRRRELHEIDQQIEAYFLRDSVAPKLLFEPIKHYNEFASKFGCDIRPERPYWTNALILNDSSLLQLRGLTSTLVSDDLDDNGSNKLVLGSAQCRFLREEGVVHVVLCHHPPQWFWDQDSLEEALNAHARIQLFGHKHSQRLDLVNNSVRLSAGAMHPDRLESGWQPRYNVLTASVSGQGDSRVLNVVVWPRVWNPTQRKFAPDFDPENSPNRRFPIPIDPGRGPSPRRTEPETAAPVQAQAPAPAPVSTTVRHMEGRAMDPARRLVYRFLSIPYHTRVSIANALGIWRDEEKDLPSIEAFRRCFVRAKQQGVLERLSEEVEKQFTSNTNSAQSASVSTVGEH